MANKKTKLYEPPATYMRLTDGSGQDWRVFLCVQAKTGGGLRPYHVNVNTIAEELNVSTRTVHRSLIFLVKKGMLERSKKYSFNVSSLLLAEANSAQSGAAASVYIRTRDPYLDEDSIDCVKVSLSLNNESTPWFDINREDYVEYIEHQLSSIVLACPHLDAEKKKRWATLACSLQELQEAEKEVSSPSSNCLPKKQKSTGNSFQSKERKHRTTLARTTSHAPDFVSDDDDYEPTSKKEKPKKKRTREVEYNDDIVDEIQ